MADNTTLNPGTGGDVVATDDISGVKFQRVKVVLGNEGVNDGDISASNPVPVNTELPAAAALADNTANPTVPAVGAFVMMWDGANWDRAPGTSADGLTVNLGANNDVTVTSGTVTIGAALPTGSNVLGFVRLTDGVTSVDVVGDALKVDGSAVTQPISGTIDIGTVTNAVSVLGTTAHDSSATSVNPLLMGGYGSASAPSNVSTDGDAVRAWFTLNGAQATVITAAGALIGGDNTFGLDVDVTRVPAPLSTTGGGTEDTALRVTVANDSTGVLSVDDNGGSLTVDGTVSVSGTVDTELPAAAALADNTANPTVPAVGAFAMAFDGSTWDRIRGDSTDGLLVNLGTNNDVTVTSGTITVTQATASNLNAQVVGAAANDAPVAGNPVLVAGRASAAAPADVSGDGDAVSAWRLRNGSAAVTLTAAGALIGGDATNGLDVDITRIVPATNTTVSGALNALNAAVTISGEGASIVYWDMASGGTLNGTVTFEATIDDTTWFPVDQLRLNSPYQIASTNGTSDTRGYFLTNGYSQIRMRVSAYTSGSTTGRLEKSAAGTPNVQRMIGLHEHDQVAAGEGNTPVLTGGYASAAAPSSVSADGDAVRAWYLRNGAAATVLTAAGALIGGDATNGLDVDVTRVQGTVTVDTELPAAAALSENFANPTAPAVGAFGMVWDGANWDRAPGNSTDGLTVNLGTNNDVIQATASNLNAQVVGPIAHDAAATTANPLLVGGYSSAAAPTDVTADGEAVRAWFLRNGARATVLTAAGALIGGDVTNGLDVDITRPPANLTASGALGALNAAVTIRSEGAGVIHWEIDTGTLSGTVTFEGTLDDTNWFTVEVANVLPSGRLQSLTTQSSFSSRGYFLMGGMSQVRMRVSAFTSGTSNARLEASTGAIPSLIHVEGGTHHDDPITASTLAPVTMGGYASAAAPADVSADGDAVRAWYLRNGAAATVLTAAGALIGGDATNGLDVDVTRVQGTVTVDTELPAAAALADNAANPTAPAVGAFGMVWDGATWDRAPGNSTDGLTVNLGTNNDVIQATASNLNAQVVGPIAHDATATTANPLLIGGYASAAAPTSVTADNEAVRAWYLRNGAAATVLTAAGALIGGDATNGLDVDVTRVQGTVTVDTELPAAAALADNTANPTVPAVGAFTMVWDGANWDRAPGNSTDGLTVKDSQALTDNTGFTDGTSKVFPVGYIFDETSGTALTENNAAAARIDSKRAQVLVIEDGTLRGNRATVTNQGFLAVSDRETTITSVSNVAASATNVNIQITDESRFGMTIFNDSSVNMYVKLGATASLTSFTVKIAPGGYWECPYRYQGNVDAIWDSATGTARVTVFFT